MKEKKNTEQTAKTSCLNWKSLPLQKKGLWKTQWKLCNTQVLIWL